MNWVQRPSEPLRKLAVETINGEAEGGSPYRAALLAAGFAAEYKALVLRRRF
ncbi:MAG: hypothetical protein H0W72_12335 [Planctomycetes bacterium]|nr:hypothetical protein [Planctomycetota bacterium]